MSGEIVMSRRPMAARQAGGVEWAAVYGSDGCLELVVVQDDYEWRPRRWRRCSRMALDVLRQAMSGWWQVGDGGRGRRAVVAGVESPLRRCRAGGRLAGASVSAAAAGGRASLSVGRRRHRARRGAAAAAMRSQQPIGEGWRVRCCGRVRRG